MNYKIFTKMFVIICVLGLIIVAVSTIYIDPFFHFHKPHPEFFYTLKSQRYQNDGILKHFEYDSIITGTSMTENFKTSEFDNLFNARSVKVSYSGAKFKELNDAIKVAYNSGKNVKYVVRSLDLYNIAIDKDAARDDLGEYPVYLYNDNIFDDIKYIFNRDAFFGHTLKIIKDKITGKNGGITSFDEYSNWNKRYKFGREVVLSKYEYIPNVIQRDFSDSDLKIAVDNIKANIVDLAKEHPENTFYYLIPPYSVVWWGMQSNKGELVRMLEAEKLMIMMILECPNIQLFSFNLKSDIINNLDNYKDSTHYGEWINSDILRYMNEGKYRITKENYEEYVENAYKVFMTQNYNVVNHNIILM